MNGLIVDLFAGGGGASAGIEAALGRPVDIAINHDPVALAVHKANHPNTRHLEADIWEVKPEEATEGRRVALLWASPDCTHFSVAKGGKPRSKKIRSLAWAVTRWAKATRPGVIFLENVTEFQGWGPLCRDGTPDKRYMGRTFRRWKGRLERLGYVVDYRILDASLYGAPTRRRRLFLIARCDGSPIVWPEVTHGKGKLPLHTAAECIDWSLPCPSIFERKKPLAEKTLWRIREGIRRFVLENPKPFIVSTGGPEYAGGPADVNAPLGTVLQRTHRAVVVPSIVGVGGRAGQSAPTGMEQPVGTITRKNDRAVVVPALVEMNHSNRPRAVDEPLGAVTTQDNRFNLLAPHLVKVNHGKDDHRGESLQEPLTTVTAERRGHALISPSLIEVNHGVDAKTGRREHSLEEPLGTVMSGGNGRALIAPTLIQTGYGEDQNRNGGAGQPPRALDLHQPLGTVVAEGVKHALVSAFVAKHFGDQGQRPGSGLDEPVSTITASDHNALAAATLLKLRGHCHGAQLDLPMPTITTGGGRGGHLAEVRAFLTAYYSTDGAKGKGQQLSLPMRAVTSKDRLGLVTVEGTDYQIVDIGMRMLQPHELLRAQFGRFAASTDLSVARTKAAMVRLIGNSVCPEVAEAIVAANHVPLAGRKAA